MITRSRSTIAARNSLLSISIVLIGGVGGIATIPIYLHYIPIDMYGAWLVSGNIIMWATLIDPGFSVLTQQQVAASYGRGDILGLGKTIFSGLTLNFGMAAILMLIAATLVYFLPHFFSNKETLDFQELQIACWITSFGTGLNVAAYAIRAAGMGLQSSFLVQAFAVSELIVSMLAQIIFVSLGWGLYGIAMGSIIRGGGDLILCGSYLYYRIRTERIPLVFSTDFIRRMLSLSTFTFLSRATESFSRNIDSFLISKLISIDSAVYFRMTRTPFDVCTGVINRPAAAIAPVVSHLYGSGELETKREHLNRFYNASIWITIFCASGILTFNQQFISLWVGPQFYAGSVVTLLLAVNLILISFYRVLLNIMESIGEIRPSSLISYFQSIVMLCLLCIGGYFFGLEGVAASGIIAGLYANCHSFYILVSKRFFSFQDLTTFLKEVSISCLTGFLSMCLTKMIWIPGEGWPLFLAKITIFLFIFSVFQTSLSKNARFEIANLINFFKKLINLRGKNKI